MKTSSGENFSRRRLSLQDQLTPRRSSDSSSRSMLRARRRNSAKEMLLDRDDTAALDQNDERLSLFCPLPKGFFYSKAYKEHKKKKLKDKKNTRPDDGSSVDDEIPLKRDLTRRKRNSFRCSAKRSVEAANVTAFLAARIEAEKPAVTEVYVHSASLVAGLAKHHMLDISLVGNDNIPVRASRFILACYSPILENWFYKGHASTTFNATLRTVEIDFCNSQVLRAAVYHCFSGEFPTDFDVESPSEEVARNLAQLDQLAHIFQFRALGEQVYRTARKLINRRPVLACAIFDELSQRDELGTIESTKRYSLETMRDMPMATLLGGGVQWMKVTSLESIMQDQDLDVDELYMFKILKSWETGATRVNGDRFLTARRLSKYIELKFIGTKNLLTEVKSSGYFDDEAIFEAVKLIEESLANREPHEMERVLVEGAGTTNANGIYVRVEEDVGLSEEEILFVKEADDGLSDIGLYLWGTTWHIAMCADYSNCFYSCHDDPSRAKIERVPKTGWGTLYSGVDPPPTCTFLPKKPRASRLDLTDTAILAPNLEEMMDPTIAEKRRSYFLSRGNDDTTEKRWMTLEQMMNLPEDSGDICASHE